MINIVAQVEKIPVFENKFCYKTQRFANIEEKFQNISTG